LTYHGERANTLLEPSTLPRRPIQRSGAACGRSGNTRAAAQPQAVMPTNSNYDIPFTKAAVSKSRRQANP